MPELLAPDYGADWQAMREWLIKTRAAAGKYVTANRGYPVAAARFHAQIEVLSSALDFMDERERAPQLPEHQHQRIREAPAP